MLEIVPFHHGTRLDFNSDQRAILAFDQKINLSLLLVPIVKQLVPFAPDKTTIRAYCSACLTRGNCQRGYVFMTMEVPRNRQICT